MYWRIRLFSGKLYVSSMYSVCATTALAAPLLLYGSRNALAAELTEAQRQLNVESFDHVWTTVRDKHWDASLGGLDWQAIRDELRPKVESAPSVHEARTVMRSMLARLGLSHCLILPIQSQT